MKKIYPEGYSALYGTVDFKEKTIFIKYNENITRDGGVLEHLIRQCKVIAPKIEDALKKEALMNVSRQL